MSEFKETQSFNQPWLWIIGLMPILIIISVLIVELINGDDIKSEDFIGMATTVLVTVLTFSWIKFLRLETKINPNGIYVHFKGLIFAKRHIAWNEVASAEIVKYDPLWDYGGWGVKFGFSKGWCYNVSGDIGLSLKLKNGKQFLVGTQKPDELKVFLNSVYKF